MEENLRNEYEKVKDKLSEEDFLKKIELLMEENEDNPFYNEMSAAEMIIGKLSSEQEVDQITSDEDSDVTKIDELLDQRRSVNIEGGLCRCLILNHFKAKIRLVNFVI